MYQNKTIKEILALFHKGELDIIEWNKYFIDNIKSKESEIKAWVDFDENIWLQNLDFALNNFDSRFVDLLGIPIGVKDIFNTIDMPTSMGSPLWKGFTPGNDARVVHNIKFQGGVIAGKTVTAEFAVHTPNETRNPWNTEYSPGTSSSGSAAAVASGMIPVSIGTQTAGSIIRPASYCGVFGFKPTFGTLPRTGMLKTTDTLDSIGLFATNIDDCKLLFDVMRVKGLDYPFVNRKLENEHYQSKISKKWKVAILFDQIKLTESYSDYAKKAFYDFILEIKENQEIEVIFPDFPQSLNDAHKVQEIIYHKALAYYFKKEFEKNSLISEVMCQIISEGNRISPGEYQAAIQNQIRLTEEVDTFLNDYDIIITLSTAGHAPKFGVAIDPEDSSLIWTMCGLPVINIPQFNHNGLPFGLQVVARKYSDYKLINFINEMTTNGVFPKFSKINV